jgi:hypothetical protein
MRTVPTYRLGVVSAPTPALGVMQTSNDDFRLRAVLDWSSSD